MESNVDAKSPFEAHDSWAESIEQHNFEPILDFNNVNFNIEGSGNIDPRKLTKTATPDLLNDGFSTLYRPDDLMNSPKQGFSNTFGTTPTPPPPSAAPDFQQPQDLSVKFSPLDLPPHPGRQRSISEPPDGFAQHHRHPLYQPTVTFTREGHPLGEPHTRYPASKKCTKSRGSSRLQPYKTKAAMSTAQQARYQLRHVQTQPTPPTSVPQPMMPPHLKQAGIGGMPMQAPFQPTSRVCTPAPEETSSPLPQNVDPMLTRDARSTAASVAGSAAKAMLVPVTVEHLQSIIGIAVQMAVKEAVRSIQNQSPQSGDGETDGGFKCGDTDDKMEEVSGVVKDESGNVVDVM